MIDDYNSLYLNSNKQEILKRYQRDKKKIDRQIYIQKQDIKHTYNEFYYNIPESKRKANSRKKI